MEIVIIGISSKTNTLHVLKRGASNNKFQLTAPELSSDQRKKEVNYKLVDTIEEAAELIRKGYYARMANVDNDQAPDIIAPSQIRIVEVPK